MSANSAASWPKPRPRVPTEACPHCGGSGRRSERTGTGSALRSWRERHDVRLRAVAAQMGLTPSYVSDLELGRREWGGELVERYCVAVERLAEALR